MNLLLFLLLLGGLSAQTGLPVQTGILAHDDVAVCPLVPAPAWTAIGSRSLTYLHPSLEGEPARYTGEPYDPGDESYLASNELPAGAEVCLIRFVGDEGYTPLPPRMLSARGRIVDTGSAELGDGLDGSEKLFEKLGTLAEGRLDVEVFVLRRLK